MHTHKWGGGGGRWVISHPPSPPPHHTHTHTHTHTHISHQISETKNVRTTTNSTII